MTFMKSQNSRGRNSTLLPSQEAGAEEMATLQAAEAEEITFPGRGELEPLLGAAVAAERPSRLEAEVAPLEEREGGGETLSGVAGEEEPPGPPHGMEEEKEGPLSPKKT